MNDQLNDQLKEKLRDLHQALLKLVGPLDRLLTLLPEVSKAAEEICLIEKDNLTGPVRLADLCNVRPDVDEWVDKWVKGFKIVITEVEKLKAAVEKHKPDVITGVGALDEPEKPEKRKRS